MEDSLNGSCVNKFTNTSSRPTSTSIQAKIARIQNGGLPRVLDLFAGCGGLSLGFQKAGFDIVGGVENDPEAAVSHAINFHGVTPPKSRYESREYARDIRDIEPSILINQLNLGQTDTAIDVLVGGPPCQAYARVGRPKLREVMDHPDAYRVDPRGNLYLRYLDYVKALRPLVIVMENVPDVLNYGGHNVAEETAEVLNDLGYECRYSLVNSAFYGVPQMRERMILLAYHRELSAPLAIPTPTHSLTLPRGYHGARQVALKHRHGDGRLKGFAHFIDCPPPDPSAPPAVSALQALGDLPPITYHLTSRLERGRRPQPEAVRYRKGGVSKYALAMRQWPGFETTGEICDHIIRHLPRDYRIFRRMKAGDQYPEAHAIAEALFEKALHHAERSGHKVDKRSKLYKELYRAYVPPYDPAKFPNKWRKMEPDKPARTVMAHLGKDSYSHIHYDSGQARPISVREAARLQSFPDRFIFFGAMNAAFRQIGNAVPPLLAHAVAERVMKDAIKPLMRVRSPRGSAKCQERVAC